MIQNKQSYPTIKDFVLQEAHQKAFERLVMGLKDYEKEKQKIISEKKDLLEVEFQKKHKDNDAQKRIQKSAKINESRMKKMNARHQNLVQLVSQAEDDISQLICNDQGQYIALLQNLIVEGLIKLLEPIVYVRCLNRDKAMIKKILPQCKKQFQELIEKEGIDKSVGELELKIDDRYSLSERKVGAHLERVKKSEENNICFGGVILTNQDGLIVLKNTLDARLELAYQHMLPTIRSELFNC